MGATVDEDHFTEDARDLAEICKKKQSSSQSSRRSYREGKSDSMSHRSGSQAGEKHTQS